MKNIKYYNVLKSKHPKAVILIETPENFITFKEDAEAVARFTGGKLTVTADGMPTHFATCEKEQIFDLIASFTTEGVQVGLCKPLKSKS